MSHGPDPKAGLTQHPAAEATTSPVATGGASEEAEHALHHSHHPFDRQVAMTMVVIAALLATVKVVGHRAHNEALSLLTEKNDKWAEFQAQKFREHLYSSQAESLVAMNPAVRDQINALQPAIKADTTKDEEKEEDSEIKIWARLDIKDSALKSYEIRKVVKWAKQVEVYKKKEKDLSAEAAKLEKKAEVVHHQTYYYDMGELFIELSLVLSSVAILTKRPPFWFGGIGVGIIGLVLAFIGWFAH